MKFKAEYKNRWYWNRDATNVDITIGKRKLTRRVTKDVENFIKKFRYVEISDKYFPGSTELKAEADRMDGGFGFRVHGKTLWACSEGLRSVGLSMSKLGKLYIKARR